MIWMDKITPVGGVAKPVHPSIHDGLSTQLVQDSGPTRTVCKFYNNSEAWFGRQNKASANRKSARRA